MDFGPAAQSRLLRVVFPAQLSGFDYPARADNYDHAYRLQNSQFGEADARALFALLRHWQPQRLIEVGSGYSTLLAADINRRFLDGAMRITAIEPYPRPFLRSLEALHALRVERLQDTPASAFAELSIGNVLFIDSSQVLVTGSEAR